MTIENAVIIGSGPAGYTAAIYLARAGLDPIVVTSAVEPGGALMNTTEVENYPGFADGILGPHLMASMEEQAQRFGARLIYDDVTAVQLDGEIKTLTLGDGSTIQSRTVILATGAAHRHLDVPGEDRLAGRGVSWCATCDGFFFKGKDILVVGGGDTALEEALFLTRFANTVTIVHRRDQFRASKIMAARVADHPKITVRWNTAIDEIHGEDTVTGVTLRDTVTGVTLVDNGEGGTLRKTVAGETTTIDTDGIFIAVGHDPRSALFADQIVTDQHGYVTVNHPTTATNLRGVFACGDLVDSRYRQAITAAGTGCAAALDAERYLADHEA